MAGRRNRSTTIPTQAGRVLIAEDDSYYRGILEDRLRNAGHDVVCVSDGAEAWSVLENRPFEVLLADWMMPTMDGYELCARVKTSTQMQDLYCVLLTTRDRMDDAADALDGGADDFLVKPCDDHTLLARVRTGIRVSRLHGRLDEVARRDSLTGTHHAGSLSEKLFDEISRAHRANAPLSLVLVSFDALAHINDNHGHAVGDEILAGAGQRILARVRAGETVVRTGGDEFAVVLPNTGLEGAAVVARDLEELLGQIALPRADVFPYRVSASAGFAPLDGGAGVDEMLQAARDALADRRVQRHRDDLRSLAH